LDITTKMHIALAMMLTIYIVPLGYLVWLARHEHAKPKTQPQVDTTKKRQ
jgi:hypothetical protein